MCTRCKFGGRQGCDSSLRRCPGLWVCGLNAVLLSTLSLSRLSERERESLLTKGSNELRSRLSGFLYRLDLTCMPKIENRTLRGPRTARTHRGEARCPRNANRTLYRTYSIWRLSRGRGGSPPARRASSRYAQTRVGLERFISHTHTHILCVRSYLRGNPPRAEGRAHACSVESARGRMHMHLGHVSFDVPAVRSRYLKACACCTCRRVRAAQAHAASPYR